MAYKNGKLPSHLVLSRRAEQDSARAGSSWPSIMAEAWVRVRRVARAPHIILLTVLVQALDSAKPQESGELLLVSSSGASCRGSSGGQSTPLVTGPRPMATS